MAPDLDPDAEDETSFYRLFEVLDDPGFDDWLDAHPDKELVAQYWQETDLGCRRMVADIATHLVAKGNSEEVVIDHDEGRTTVLRRDMY